MASITVEDYELRENEEGGSKTIIIKKTLKQLTSWTKSLVWCTNNWTVCLKQSKNNIKSDLITQHPNQNWSINLLALWQGVKRIQSVSTLPTN